MQTKAKSNSVLTHKVDGTVITWHVLTKGDVMLDTDDLGESIRAQAMTHGIIQRVSDAAAISRTDENGRIRSAEEMAQLRFDGITRLVEHYATGTNDWRLAGERAERGSFLLSAMCEAYPKKTRETLSAWLKERSAKERTALGNEPRIKVIIDRLTQAATSGVDTGDMLSELDGE